MRRADSEDRQCLTLSPTRRLEDATGRRELVLQQENFDRQEKVVQHELKSLHNMNAAISIFPSEILSTVFEAGALLDSSSKCHFGSLVSHVSRHWRKIALATPRLWNKIECTRSKAVEDGYTYMTYSELERERVAAFLSRSKSSPVDIRIRDFYDDYQDDIQTRNFLAMLGDQVGQFYHLCINDGDPDDVRIILRYFSHTPASILRSIVLGTHSDHGILNLKSPLFPFGAPHLTIAQLDCIPTSSLQFCLPSFQHLQCLRLAGIAVDGHEFRDALMALPVLKHLELSVDNFSQRATRFPAVLPTLIFLQVKTYLHTLDCAILAITIHAASLTTLSLSGWDGTEPKLNLSSEEALESHFPALQHLILANGRFSDTAPDLEAIARRFPEIERLTCQVLPNSGLCYGIDHILATIDAGSSGDGSLRWPKLHTVAVAGSRTPLDAAALHHKIYVMRGAGHPLRQLKLHKSLLAQAGTKAMGYLRTIVDVEDFSLDWPTPFEGFA
ncbi:hypothetical protein FIBSPDRAFT_891303 [Athelia psychrophila]|uniref:Uncharacterized protein n=1 Tax=Athelia psychrophila TaxID=1759441 RepID=A0A166JRI1_9AGAM|nr:hypothetical protein FIBSPDRAFT_891303 [Fibularhizoctonia sp. CBS 109695]